MRRATAVLRVAIALLISAASAALAQDATPKDGIVVRTSVDPAAPVIGQHVRLVLDVLFPGRMPAPPRVEALQPPGLQIFRFESQGLTIRETIDGAPYVGQRFEFAVYPRRAGSLSIPPVEVRLMDRAGDQTGTLASQPQTLAVSAPPGMDPSRPAIASTRVTLTDSWDPANAKLMRIGDAIVRVIKREADDTPSLAFAPLDAGALEGVRAYADQPLSEDRVERGRLTGERTDRIIYVLERPGDYLLPPVSQIWWDLSAGGLRHASKDGRRVTVAATPAGAKGGGSAAFARLLTRRPLAALAGGAVAIGLIGWFLAARIVGRRRQREALGPSEAELFSRLKHAARGEDSGAAYRALAAWRDATAIPRHRLAALPSVQALERTLFAAGPRQAAAPPRGLIADLQALRSKRGAVRERRAAEESLPPLNPAAADCSRAR